MRAEDHAPLGLEGGVRVAGGGGKDCREGGLQLRAEQGQLAGLWPSTVRARELKPEPQSHLVHAKRISQRRENAGTGRNKGEN